MSLKTCAALIALASLAFALAMPVVAIADYRPTNGNTLAKVLGSGEVRINSSHTMRSEEIGKGLKVTARAADGVVKAFEHETLPVMGFQFHPERMTDDPKFVELLRVALSPVNGK